MDIRVAQGSIAEQEVDCLIVNLFEGVTTPGGATASVDRSLDGAIGHIIEGGDFTGEAGTSILVYTNGNLPASRVLVVGLGKADAFDIHGVRKAAATAAKALCKLKNVRTLATVVHGAGAGGLDVEVAAQALVEGTMLANYRPPAYKREPSESRLETLTVVEFDTERIPLIEAGVHKGKIIAGAVCHAQPVQRAGQCALSHGVCGTRPAHGRRDRPALHRPGRGRDARTGDEHLLGRQPGQRARSPVHHSGPRRRRVPISRPSF